MLADPNPVADYWGENQLMMNNKGSGTTELQDDPFKSKL